MLKQWLGTFQWVKPTWMRTAGQKIKRHPILSFCVFLLLSTAIAGIIWYDAQPKPLLITARIMPPKPTPLAKVLLPNPVSFEFGYENQATKTWQLQPAAALSQMGKLLQQGVHIQPGIAGQWQWETDSRLVFKPEQDWLAGQTYTVSIDQNLFSTPHKMAAFSYSFTTAAFAPQIKALQFYQDPTDPNIRQVTAAIEFNFPVDPNSLANHISIAWQTNTIAAPEPSWPLNITYDQYKRIAYVRTQTLSLPETPRYATLTLAKGIEALSHTASSLSALRQNILIPDHQSYFKILQTKAVMVRDEKNRPSQILTIESSLGVQDTALKKAVHVYLLPKDYPASSTRSEIKNYDWQNPGEITPAILNASSSVSLEALPSDRAYATLHSYRFNVPENRSIYVVLDQGITALGDFRLNQAYRTVLKAPAYPKDIRFIHSGALLALTGEKKLSVGVRGLPAVKFSIARILPENVNQLVTQTSGDFNNPYFLHDSFNQQNISEIFSEIRTFQQKNDAQAEDASKEYYTALDLEKYLNHETPLLGPHGLFLLQGVGWNPVSQTPLEETKVQRLVLITDLGMLVKDNADKTHDVFVQSITSGEPVANAQISLLGKNGLPLLSRTTDAQGHALFPDVSSFIEEQEPVVYLADFNHDVSFIPYRNDNRQLNVSRFDVGGLQMQPGDTQRLSAYLFSDRGLYRPGEDVHVGVIVKAAFAKALPPGLPLELTITDPRGNLVYDEKLALNQAGFFTANFLTEAVSPTGNYQVNLYLMKNQQMDTLLGNTSFQVADFLPDRLRLSAQLSPKTASTSGWLPFDKLTAHISLYNLYGAPAAHHRIASKLVLTPPKLSFAQFPEYVFTDPLRQPDHPLKTICEDLPDVQTNEQGQADIPLDLNAIAKATFQLSFLAEGFEAGSGRSVKTQVSALISTLPYLIGYKAVHDLQFIALNTPETIQLIAVDPQVKALAVDNLKLQISQIVPVTTLVKKEDGSFQYQSLPETKVLSTQAFSLAQTGTVYHLPTQQVGEFVLTLLDKQNQVVARIPYRVTGDSALPTNKQAALTVKLNKAEYQPGETIQLQIIAPYTGAGLITIEQNKVYAMQWFKTNQTSSMQNITIPANLQGNAYVNVAFTRDWNSPDIVSSPLSYSIVPFTISHQSQILPMSIDVPETARPGEDLTITYHSDKPSKMVIFAVDEGILQAAHYGAPDPLAWFFQKRALEVTTQQTLDQILPKYRLARELSSVGGDGSAALLAAQLNPFKRKGEAPIVYWSDLLDADNTPKQVHYRIPDYFNGALQVMAVAVSDDQLGALSKSSLIHGDFVINANTPAFAAPGDEFVVTASIANQMTDAAADTQVTVGLTASKGLTLLESPEKMISLGKQAEKTVSFRVKAGASPGSMRLNWTVSFGDKHSQRRSAISIRPATPYISTINSGMSEQREQKLPLNRVLYPEHRQVKAVASSSPLILALGLSHYLKDYPYGCTEQLVSKAIPWLVMGKQPWIKQDRQQIADKLQQTIQLLRERQTANGSFSYWPGSNYQENNAFISLYAIHFLTDAKDMGYTVPVDLFNSGIAFLKEFVEQPLKNLAQARLQAYAIYLLTRHEFVTTNYLVNLQTYLQDVGKPAEKEGLIHAYMAATYQLLQEASAAQQFIQQFDVQLPIAAEDFYSRELANAQYFYLLARHFPELAQQKAATLLPNLINTLNTDSINTLLIGYTALALNAYSQFISEPNPQKLAIAAIAPNQAAVEPPASAYQALTVPDNVSAVQFMNPEGKRYFYQVMQSGFNKNTPAHSVQHGLEIYREYRNHQGMAVHTVQLGEEIEVHLQIRAQGQDEVNNIAIIDLLPGGFEVVRDSVSKNNADYIDVRDDRIIIFTRAYVNATEFVYKIKAANPGRYQVPVAYAHAMYLPGLYAYAVQDEEMVVENKIQQAML